MSIRDEVREARLAREARDAARRASSSGSGRNAVDPERRPRASLFRAPSLAPRPPSSYRLTSALGRAVAAAASTAVGHAREGAANALAAARGSRRSDLVSDEALRRIVDRVAADRAAFDAGAADVTRLAAAVRGLSEAEIAKLRDVQWAPQAATTDEQATLSLGEGDAGRRVDDEKEKNARRVRGVLRRVRAGRRAESVTLRARRVSLKVYTHVAPEVTDMSPVPLRVPCRGPRGRPRGPPRGPPRGRGRPRRSGSAVGDVREAPRRAHGDARGGERVARPAGGSAEAKRDRRIRRCVSERDARPIRCPRPRGYPWGP